METERIRDEASMWCTPMDRMESSKEKKMKKTTI